MRISLITFSLLMSCLGASAQGADDHPGFPAGEGRELVLKTCSKCHAPELAAPLQLDLDGWKEVVDQMVSNGAQVSDTEYTQITAYLAKSFGKK